ncbi:MAG: haloacid dehalogenase [Anaerolineales bacterium]|jgi:translin
MDNLEKIAEQAREEFDALTAARDKALAQARTLTRHCSRAIRAIHRDEREVAAQELSAARKLTAALHEDLDEYPCLNYAGYTRDALKEFAEATLLIALLDDGDLPTPQELDLDVATYLRGLAETVGELRRHTLDILRGGHSSEAERFLQCMDEIFSVLVTMDYPDAVTHGLRRLTDISRSIIERTRGDITLSLRQERLERALREAQNHVGD